MYYHAWGLPWLIAAVVGIIPFWRICNRVGHSPWLSLLMAVPLLVRAVGGPGAPRGAPRSRTPYSASAFTGRLMSSRTASFAGSCS
jgi:hypothetical protein